MSSSSYQSSSEYTGNSNVVDSVPIPRPHCEVFVKGGGIDDNGVIFKMKHKSPFNMIYVECAHRLGMKPSQLRLFHHLNYISPDHTPFGMGMKSVAIVSLYAKDCVTGIPIGQPRSGHRTHDSRCFTIQDCCTVPTMTRYTLKKSTLIGNLSMVWGRAHNVSGERVTLVMDGKALNGNLTLEDAEIYDGAVLYGITT